MGNTIYYPNGNTSSSPSSGGASNNTSTSFLNLLSNLLETGFTISNGEGTYCCPECTEGTEQVYFLASIPKAIQILNSLGYQQGDALNCCLNISSSTSTPAYQYFSSNFTYECCPNNFTTCVNDLTKRLGGDCCNTLQQIGIVEYGTLELTDSSPFCSILDKLLKVTPPLSDSEICNIYKEILETGVIIRCSDCKLTIERGPDSLPCFCYKVTVPDLPSTGKNVSIVCQGIPVTHTELSAGDYYYCSESDPVVSVPEITFVKQDDCSLVNCTNPPAPCICYEFVVQGPQSAPIPLQVSCQGVLSTYELNQGVHRYCSDSYPIVSPEVQITVLNDCESGPCVSPPPPNCACYIVHNPNLVECNFEYKDCSTNIAFYENIQGGQTIYLCASTQSTFVQDCNDPETLQLQVTESTLNCNECILPPPTPCVCYQILIINPIPDGLIPECTFEYLDCNSQWQTQVIVITGYICSQVVPIATCSGFEIYISSTPGDCNNPAIGCPPQI